MIQNIVFDMGQVLIHWHPDLFTDKFDLSQEDKELLVAEAVFKSEWPAMDEGTLTLEKGYERICARLPERLHPFVDRLINHWWEICLSPMEGMPELLSELKSRGYGLYVLSNAAPTFHKYFHNIPGARYFDGLYVSADHLLLKPHQEIYHSFLNTFGLKAENCFFIDDREENIVGAGRVGMKGVVYKGDVATLRRDLNEAGIFCKV